LLPDQTVDRRLSDTHANACFVCSFNNFAVNVGRHLVNDIIESARLALLYHIKTVSALCRVYRTSKMNTTKNINSQQQSHAFVKTADYRQDAAKRQTAGIRFTHRPKIRFFAPQGRLVEPIQIKLCTTHGLLGPLGSAKFHVNRCRGVGMRPQNIKNFHFLAKSRPAVATPLTDFENF